MLQCKRLVLQLKHCLHSDALPVYLLRYFDEYGVVLQNSAVHFFFTLCQGLFINKLLCMGTFLLPYMTDYYVFCSFVQYSIILTCLGSISLDGAFSPRQWILERLKEIEDAPGDDHIIIEAHKTANLRESESKQQYLLYYS